MRDLPALTAWPWCTGTQMGAGSQIAVACVQAHSRAGTEPRPLLHQLDEAGLCLCLSWVLGKGRVQAAPPSRLPLPRRLPQHTGLIQPPSAGPFLGLNTEGNSKARGELWGFSRERERCGWEEVQERNRDGPNGEKDREQEDRGHSDAK